MSNKKALIDAIELIKDYRNDAQAVSDAQLELISSMMDVITPLTKKGSDQRTPQEQAILDFYFSFFDKISVSLDKTDEYNKSVTKYISALKALYNLASSKDESI